MKRNIIISVLALFYLCGMAYFAFRPFRPIRGIQYASVNLEWADGAIQLQKGAALEIDEGVQRVRDALVASGNMSLEIMMQTDGYDQPGTPTIAAFGQSAFNQNFSLTQEGNGIEFRLRTLHNSNYRIHPSFVVPQVIVAGSRQHLVLTYDGAQTCLYIDGRLAAFTDQIAGSFMNWGRNHAFTLGDEAPGGDAWSGSIWRYSIFDRVLSPSEVDALHSGEAVAAPLLFFDFSANSGTLPAGMKKLKYRNLFITSDPAAYELSDCIFNVAGFVPLGVLAYLLLPVRVERRKILAGIVVPVLAGMAVSGTIEWLQRYVFMRVPCAPDIVYNTTGALLGGLLAWLSFSTFESKRDNGSKS